MTNEEAIFIINNRLNTYYCTDDDLKALDLAIKALEERPKGQWEFVQYDANPNIGNWHCTNCRGIAFAQYNFCPKCGADMRGDV